MASRQKPINYNLYPTTEALKKATNQDSSKLYKDILKLLHHNKKLTSNNNKMLRWSTKETRDEFAYLKEKLTTSEIR